MRSIFDAKINMFRTVAKLYSEQQARFDVIPIFPTIFTSYNAKLTSLDPWLDIAFSDPTVAAEIVTTQKAALSDAAEDVALPTGAYASVTGNIELQNTMRVRASYLVREKKDRLPTICQRIFDEADAVKVAAAPYNLTQARLDALEDAIAAYAADVNTPGLAHGEVGTALQEIAKIIATIDKQLEEQLDPLVASLENSDPPLWTMWKSARTIIDPATTHTPLTITVKTAAAQPIEAATCTLVKLSQTKTGITNAAGTLLFPTISSGEWSVTATAPDYQPFSLLNFKVVRGEENTLDVVLTAL
jgi:hypothetical protein